MRYTSERMICKDALSILNGACNPRGVMHSMIEMVEWLHDAWTEEGGYLGGFHPNHHPAIRLCMSQLLVITGAQPSGDVEDFHSGYKYCVEKGENDESRTAST